MTTELRVLIVDRNASDREALRRRLRSVLPNGSCVDAAADLRDGDYDVLLLELGLAQTLKSAAADSVRRVNDNPPIIILCAAGDVEQARRLLENGAHDYWVKSRADAAALAEAIRCAVHRRKWLCSQTAARRRLTRKNRRLAELYATAHRFVDDVSHEFRTPLTVIKEYASLIRDGLAETVETRNRFLDIVKDRADDLNTMVDDLLDVSKLEAGLLGIWRRNCHIADVIGNLRPSLERKAAVRGVKLEVEVEPALPEVYCDPEKIGRVLINLAVNAVKFCRHCGCVRIWAKSSPNEPGVIVGVTDDGPGIDPENRSKIFERFKQLERSARDGGKGFGLGLSIAKELVDLHFAELTVDGEPGRGSTFSFCLPPADPEQVMRRYLRRVTAARSDRRLSLVAAVVAETAPQAAADEIGVFLYGMLRRHDLTFRVNDRTWLIVLNADRRELQAFYERAAVTLADVNRNRIHGPLPAVDFRTLGTWAVKNDSHAWFVRALQQLSPASIVYV